MKRIGVDPLPDYTNEIGRWNLMNDIRQQPPRTTSDEVAAGIVKGVGRLLMIMLVAVAIGAACVLLLVAIVTVSPMISEAWPDPKPPAPTTYNDLNGNYQFDIGEGLTPNE